MDEPVSEKAWKYRGFSGGRLIEGIVLAKTPDDARAKLVRLRIEKAELLNDPDNPVANPSEAAKISPAEIPGYPSEKELQGQKMALAAVEQVKAAAAKSVDKISIPLAGTRPRQSLLVYKEKELKKNLLPILNAGGKIVHLVMHPDMHGDMVFAVVTEQPEGGPREEPPGA
jgi:hypothetical protein